MDKDLNGNTPLVSVLLPVYNAGEFLRAAITSILDQEFPDFELILVNDGSTDDSAQIIQSFSDPRIRPIHNEKNLGLIATLNKGIESARGKYIARMDADDISLPDRLKKQVAFLEQHPGVILATRIALINTEGQVTGEWSDDAQNTNEASIRKAMAFSNCIAHPTIMIETTVLKKYRYRTYQKSSEDWDLWMRLLADGYRICKLDEVLLHYRVHPASAMSSEKKDLSLQQRLIRVKKRFLIHQAHKPNRYFFLVLYSMFRSIGSHYKFNVIPQLARKAKRLLTTSPFRAHAQYKQLQQVLKEEATDLFFFFPYTHIGGAEQVHADITSVFKERKPVIIFTGFSRNEKFLDKFTPNGTVLNIPHAINYPFLQKKCLRLLSSHLNRKTNPHILGANSSFFYELCTQLEARVKMSDLIHAFLYQEHGNEGHKKNLAVSQRFTNRIFISSAALEQFKKFCFHQNCSSSYLQKLKLIYNYTPIPAFQKKNYSHGLGVLFVGRDSPEKRLDLFIAIADRLNKELPGKFTFTVIGARGEHAGIQFCGELTNKEEIVSYYSKSHLLALTSSREGFPLVVMEAMAHGVVPVGTPVGDIPLHITENTGFVTLSNEGPEVIKEMALKLEWYSKNITKLATCSENSYAYAQQNFSYERFSADYRSLFDLK